MTGQVRQSSDQLVWHNHYRLDRILERVRWGGRDPRPPIGHPRRPLLCVYGAQIQQAGLHAQGVAIVPADRLRSALGHDQVLADADVELLAATARNRLRPAG